MRKKLLAALLSFTMVIGMLAAPASAANGREPVVTIDAGHGGSDGSTTKIYADTLVTERELNLKVALLIEQYLEPYYVEVHQTRTDKQTDLTREERAIVAASYNSDLMFSCHMNATGTDQSMTGAYVIVPSGNWRPDLAAISQKVGKLVLQNLKSYAGIPSDGFIIRYSEDDTRYPDGSLADYYGIIKHDMDRGIPALIVEHCFLDNSSDYFKYLNTDAKLSLLAKADADAIVAGLGLKLKSEVVTSADNGDTPFDDVYTTDWFYNTVTEAYEQKLFSGRTATHFDPLTTLTREEFITVLASVVGGDVDAYADADTGFTDVPQDMWYSKYIAWASANGMTNGYGDGTFGLGDTVTREQMAVFTVAAANKCGVELKTDECGTFADESTVSDWALSAVQAVHAAGIMSGDNNGNFNPHNGVTRAEAAVVFVNMNTMYEFTMPAVEPEPSDVPDQSGEAEDPADPDQTEEPAEPAEPAADSNPSDPAESEQPEEVPEAVPDENPEVPEDTTVIDSSDEAVNILPETFEVGTDGADV